jgi:hypothetical protein
LFLDPCVTVHRPPVRIARISTSSNQSSPPHHRRQLNVALVAVSPAITAKALM